MRAVDRLTYLMTLIPKDEGDEMANALLEIGGIIAAQEERIVQLEYDVKSFFGEPKD